MTSRKESESKYKLAVAITFSSMHSYFPFILTDILAKQSKQR